MQHFSVMAAESLQGLELTAGARVCDATTGMGGHTRLLAETVGPEGHVWACDRDPESLDRARQNCADLNERITFLHSRFSTLPAKLAEAGAGPLDGLLADLGISMPQLTTPERGFSLMNDGPLDMRMDQTEDTPTAADLVNGLSERELADLIYKISGERRSRVVARALCRARPLHTLRAFAETIVAAIPRTGKLHPATLSAMSLRIAVNNEYGEVEALIDALPLLVRSGGRVVVITFHSGEDLIVKTGFRRLAKEGKAVLVNKHVLIPSPEETRRNAASRSAKMRILQLL